MGRQATLPFEGKMPVRGVGISVVGKWPRYSGRERITRPAEVRGSEEARGRDDQGPPDQGDELLRAPHHERGGQGVELEDCPHPEDGLRVSYQEPLQDSSSIPVRGIGPLPRNPPDSRMSPIYSGVSNPAVELNARSSEDGVRRCRKSETAATSAAGTRVARNGV